MNVDRVLRVIVPSRDMPNGIYLGVHTGYEVHFKTPFYDYILIVDKGVRGEVPVIVRADKGNFHIEGYSQEVK